MLVSEEIQIRAPWGFIAGKTWGDKSGIPCLALHGIQDNASTFDLLIPQLPRGFFWVAVDLPGHGRSSHFSAGLPLDFMQYVYAVKRVVEHFAWPRFHLMGHSFGAQLSTMLASILGDRVEKMILLDGLICQPIDNLTDFYRDRFKQLDDINKKVETGSPPQYDSFDAALNRFITSRPAKITDRAARTLIQRSLFPTKDGFRFTNDPRLRFRVRTAFTNEQTYRLVQAVKCPVLLVMSVKTLKGIERNPTDVYPTNVMDRIGRAFANFTFVTVPGNHDTHMNDPEEIGELVSNFILKSKPKL